ncbi:MAG: hypothetical protein KA735_08220 [Burkholderiaceae bacterium]|nr:hypothetical protein [Burkholderiaceae bacterium]
MPRFPVPFRRSTRPYCGSALLDSSVARMARVLLAVLLLWALTGWAMGWWWNAAL